MPWEFDLPHSLIGFSTKHLGICGVYGRFGAAEVTLDLDADDPAQWSMRAVIQAASLDTGFPRRDDAVKKEGYLDVEKFPTITFESRQVERRGDRFAVTGPLTLHGVTKEIELDVSYNGEVIDRVQNREVTKRGISAQTTINRLDFGVGAPVPPATVAEEIRFILEMEAIKV
jgi:polyisoprenoid-binding protein YceI